jgi:DNA-binding NarL/FixJ family response regulator
VCRALRVLCAAPDREGLVGLKRAAVAAHWELMGGATSIDELVKQLDEYAPDVVVVDVSLGPEVVGRVKAVRPGARVVALGAGTGADQEVASLDEVRGAILALPRPGGPVRR